MRAMHMNAKVHVERSEGDFVGLWIVLVAVILSYHVGPKELRPSGLKSLASPSCCPPNYALSFMHYFSYS